MAKVTPDIAEVIRNAIRLCDGDCPTAAAVVLERLLQAAPAAPPLGEGQIKHMVDRFLGWKLPESFAPDAGITYAGKAHPNHPGPTGTNLFDATQAEAMVRHMIDGLPD